MSNEDQRARGVVDAVRYMTLATADADGVPWASPVWFATADQREFVWVSDPESRHSRNLAVRPRLAIVIFDSDAPIGTGGGVYMQAVGEAVPDAEIDRCLEVFSRESEAQGGRPWTRADVLPPARVRLYRATAGEQFFGGRDDRRVPVEL